MAKSSLFQKFLSIILLCLLIVPLVKADGEEIEEEKYGKDIEENPQLEVDIKTSYEDNIRNLKVPHIDRKKERVVQKIDIPKVIHQYVRSKEGISSHTQNNINSWKSLNPDWEHKLYDFEDIKKFMETHHAKIIDLFNALNFEEKIHMWKYAVLDTYGGVYADADCFCVKPINQWLSENDKANILIGLDYLNIPKTVLVEKKLTDSIKFNIHTIASAPGHEILTNMPFYIHRYRVLGRLNTIEYEDDYWKLGRTYFSVGAALWTESVFNYLIENNLVVTDIEHGGLVKDVAILNENAFSYEADNLSNLPDDVLSVYFPEKSKLKEKNDYII